MDNEQFCFVGGCQRNWDELPSPDGLQTVGIDTDNRAGNYIDWRMQYLPRQKQPFLKATVAISSLYFKGRILRCTDALSQKAGSKTRMSAKEIKDEIQRLEPAEKLEIFRWVSKQLHLADLVQGVGVYRASWNPLRVEQKRKSIP